MLRYKSVPLARLPRGFAGQHPSMLSLVEARTLSVARSHDIHGPSFSSIRLHDLSTRIQLFLLLSLVDLDLSITQP
jgi:hypothetical protein